MGILNGFKPKKSIQELEEEREQNEAEISVLEQRLLKKQLEAKGAEISSFKKGGGGISWSRIKNWLSTH